MDRELFFFGVFCIVILFCVWVIYVLYKRNESLLLEKNAATLEVERYKTQLESEKEKLKHFTESKALLKEEFENIGLKLFAKNAQNFTEQSTKNISQIFHPFKERLEQFSKSFEEKYIHQTKENATLSAELKNLKELNLQMAKEARDLTNALKGQSQKRGAWGELILERILENSGLRKNIEYFTQESFREDNKALRPDVLVKLPDEKVIIIDSKLSLNYYEEYVNSEEGVKEIHLQKFLGGIKNHVDSLASKGYQEIDSILTLDYVLMFMPLEGAFMTLMEKGNAVFENAMAKKVAIVSPSTLMVVLKTIENIWRYERQRENIEEIIKEVNGIYDKLAGFSEDFLAIETNINRTAKSFEEANKKLFTGNGNILKRAQKLKELGASPKKEITVSKNREIEE